MKKIIFSIFILLSAVATNQNLQAATLHALLLGDTLDGPLGTAFENAVGMMHKEVEMIAFATGHSLQTYAFVDEEARRDNIVHAIETMDIAQDDMVIVYLAIHGYRNPNKKNPWPSLYFGIEKTGLDFQYVNQMLLQKSPRFLLSIADSCNNTLGFNFPTLEQKALIPYTEEFILQNYHNLFIKAHGHVIVSSSLPGEFSWAYPSIGGLWTLQFLQTFKTTLLANSAPTWEEIMQEVAAKVVATRIAQKGAIQNAQYDIQIRYQE